MQASASEACTFCAHACLQGLNSYAYFYAADIVDGSLHPVNQRCSACVQGLLHACRSHTDPYQPAAVRDWHSIRLHQAPHHWQENE